MSTDAWLEANNRYLAASLQWMRLRLRRLIAENPTPSADFVPTPPPGLPEPKGGWFRGWLGPKQTTTTKEMKLLPQGKGPSIEEQLAEAVAERDGAAAMDPPPALLLLAERFGLSDFERDTLLLCAAMEFDPGMTWLCAQAQGSSSRPWPSFGLALSALDDPSWDALSVHRPLRYARLIEVNQPGGTPLTSSSLRADERVVNFLKGLNVLDDWLGTLLALEREDPREGLSDSQAQVAETIFHRLQNAVAESGLPVVQLMGSDPASKVAVANRICLALNRQLYRIAAEALPQQVADIETLARLWQRETLLLPVALYIAGENLDTASADLQAALRRFLTRGVGLVFLGLPETPAEWADTTISALVNKPTAREQEAAWSSLTGVESESKPTDVGAMLAGQFNLNLTDIRKVASSAAKEHSDDLTLNELWDRCRDLTRPRLDTLAQRLQPKATWDDLVLPPEPMALIRRIAGQVRTRHRVYDQWGFSEKMNRGFGISALFSGESGTGKTMAAEVIANDLRLNLYRIDLSAVVSKYIGETEKNLRKLFDAAEQGGAILFFDEADALFGKRSEVKDSHDRYANIEINYLLQRMEAFSGLAILATNMKSALDPAFMRRLRFIVDLPFPGVRERQLIWEKALPPGVPKQDLDYARLARLNISGGNIHSIALNAAFAAAGDGQTVTMPILLAAARAEMRKLEKPIHESEFR
jgi:hypothetical protein